MANERGLAGPSEYSRELPTLTSAMLLATRPTTGDSSRPLHGNACDLSGRSLDSRLARNCAQSANGRPMVCRAPCFALHSEPIHPSESCSHRLYIQLLHSVCCRACPGQALQGSCRGCLSKGSSRQTVLARHLPWVSQTACDLASDKLILILEHLQGPI
jgi:hypothetical protein